MIIEADTRQQKDGHILKYLNENEIKYIRNKLYAGDYKILDDSRIIIDTKKDLLEMCMNLCRTTEHERIKREIMRGREIGCERFIFLICDEKITSVDEVENWVVPQRKNGRYLTKVQPKVLKKIMKTMIERYGCEFIFTKKENMGKMVVELLMGDTNVEQR